MDTEQTTLRDDARWVVALVLATATVYLLLGLLSLAVLIGYEGERIPSGVLGAIRTGSVIQILLFIAGGVAWLLWQRRANVRLRAAAREGMRFSPSWTVGWYFVPFANLVMVPQAMQELWQASEPAAGPSEWKTAAPSSLVYGWWSTFILGNMVSRVGLPAALGGERTGALLSDVLSSMLVVTAGILAVILIRRLEDRLRAVASATLPDAPAERASAPAEEPRARLGHAIAGVVVGAFVAASWWVLVARIVNALDLVNDDAVLAFPVAMVFGAIVGFWSLLGAGGRRRAVTIAAGVGAFIALYKANVLARGPFVLVLLRDLAIRPAAVLRYFASTLTDPFLLGVALLAAVSAVAVAGVKLPIDVWRIGENAPGDGGQGGEPKVADTPPVARASQAVQAPPPSAPVAEDPSAGAAGLGSLRELLARNRSFLLGLLAGAVVVAVAVTAFALGRGDRRRPDSTPSASPAQRLPVQPTPVEPANPDAPPPDAMPEDVVKALYEAAARGDEQAARATLAPGFDLEADSFRKWGDPKYEIMQVTAGKERGEVKVEVREPGGGFSDRDYVTWTLRGESGGWRITGWWLGKIVDDPDFGANAGDPAQATVQESVLNADKAKSTLALFLQWRMVGDIKKMRGLATAGMDRRQPELFTGAFGEFTQVWALSVYQESGDYVVKVREKWKSGTQTHEYVVVEENGTALVDEQR